MATTNTATSFGSLPSEIVGRILDQDGMSAHVIDCWMTGDSLLRNKIAKGVTRMVLYAQKEHTFNRIPKFLPQLLALREFAIEAFAAILGLDDIEAVVKQLPPTLLSLKLNFLNSAHILPLVELSSESIAASTSGVAHPEPEDLGHADWTLATTFPLLQSLYVRSSEHWGEAELKALPVTLTSLGLELPEADQTTFVGLLPRTLRHLTSNSDPSPDPSIFAHLPPQLESLTYDDPPYSRPKLTDEQLQQLPPTITSLKDVIHNLSLTESILLLPKGLTSLRVNGFDGVWSRVNTLLDMSRFTALKEVNFANASLSFESLRLAPNLAILQTHSDVSNMQPEDWPKSLTKLVLEEQPTNVNFTSLPPLLRALHISAEDEIDLSFMAQLPATLTTLVCSNPIPNQNIVFPPALTELDFSHSNRNKAAWWCSPPAPCDNNMKIKDTDEARSEHYRKVTLANSVERIKVEECFPYERLPQSIKTLAIESPLPASRLKYLPRALTSLRVADIFNDADFDPKGKEELQAVKEMKHAGRISGIHNLLDLDELESVSIFGLLPRTLTYLCTSGSSLVEGAVWSHWPTRLFNIVLAGAVDGDILFHLPMKNSMKLFVAVRDMRDDHLRAVPQSLFDATITYSVDRVHHLSREALLLHHPSMGGYTISSDFLRPYQAWARCRDRAHRNDNAEEFYRLMDRENASLIDELNLYATP